MKKDRLLAIVMLLLNRKRMSSAELARHFEVSLRTIYRDIDAIGRAGIPVLSIPGRSGGFGIMESYRLDRNVLDRDDMSSVITALKGVSTAINDWKISGTLEKFRSFIQNSGKNLVPGRETLVFNLSGYGNRRYDNLIKLVRKAVDECQVLAFNYRDSSLHETCREIEPYTLVCYGSAWYIYGFCRLRKDFRIFRLSRIKDAALTGEIFSQREIDWESKPWERIWINRETAEMLLKIYPGGRSQAEDFFGSEKLEPCGDGNFLVQAVFPVDDWVYSFILGFGDNAEVLKPEELRELIAGRICRMADRYK